MSHRPRDPETGQFLPGGGEQYDDIEVVSFGANTGVTAAGLGGGTSFLGTDSAIVEGLLLIDYDEVVDRNEELHLLHASHVLSVFANSTETADGTVLASCEVSAAPSLNGVGDRAGNIGNADIDSGETRGAADFDDTIDLVGRVLMATGHAPFSDGATGTGGGGSAGEDHYDSSVFPEEVGRFHPRDELFMNTRFETYNIDDSGVHASLSGQHIYGVIAE